MDGDRTGVRAAAVAVVAVLAVGLSACRDSADSSTGAPVSSTPSGQPTGPGEQLTELVPGRPGEESTTRDPSQEVGQPDAEHDDVAFMQMMVLHHRQALDMAALVPDRSDSREVREIAARIEAAQAPEILVMAQWLTERSVDVPEVGADPRAYDHGEHGHAGMQGMLTPEQLDELADADGTDFDRLFLGAMVRHHEGAVAMARHVLGAGADLRVGELATDVVAEQSAEITRLERILAGLPEA